MDLTQTHPWPHNVDQAKQIQQNLRHEVITQNELGEIRFVAGVDVGFEQYGSITRAAVAVLDLPQLHLHTSAIARRKTVFPYIPGYLSFREVPAIMDALGQLNTMPDMLLCDGQGLAHPRRFGLACHLGILTGLPSIGVAKSRLIGTHDEIPMQKGGWQPLMDKDETLGAVLRTRSNVSPVYVSIGHRIDLPTAIDYVLRCTTRYRLPETTRWAHKLASG